MENEEIEDIANEQTDDYSWNDLGIAEYATQSTVVTSKKSMGYINYASKDGKWYYSVSYEFKSGSYEGMSYGVSLKGVAYPTKEEAQQEAWKELKRCLTHVGHEDAKNLLAMVCEMIDDEKDQLELF